MPNHERNGSIRPILRWAGGKSDLLPSLIKLLPKTYERYVEPMMGAGALFFGIDPAVSVLADVNEELINFYRVLRDDEERLIKSLMRLRATKKEYYKVRSGRPRNPMRRAIRFAYLNRLCWNALYRVNMKGQFNVPIGSRLPAQLWAPPDLQQAAKRLKRTTLRSSDFGYVLRDVQKGDFVFLDPPYPKGARGRGTRGRIGFNRYSSSFFSYQHHQRLSEWVEKLHKRGVKVMLTISESQLLAIYPKFLRRHAVTSNSLISCNGATRGRVRELILTNY